jgi:hypothetical protein
MTTGEDTMNVQIVSISPEKAVQLLTNNASNRALRQRYVDTLAHQMRNGFWKLAGDPIRIDTFGRLLDGQHRLNAVVQSGTVQTFVLIDGLASESQLVMDSGIRRRFSDMLKMAGESNYFTLAAIVRMVALSDRGFKRNELTNLGIQASVTEMSNVLARHPELREAASFGQAISRDYHMAGRIAGFCWWDFGNIDADDRDEFFRRLKVKDFVSTDDPLSRLYLAMLENASSPKRLSEVAKFAMFVKTWNFYRDGAEVKLLRWRRGGAKPEAFPTPY